MKKVFVALQKFQVFPHGHPQWLEVGDLVPTHYMGERMIAQFVRMGYMEPKVEYDEDEAEAMGEMFAIAEILDAQDREAGDEVEEVEEV